MRHILLRVTYFTHWFIYNFIHEDASMARRDKGLWQKKAQWSELRLDIKEYTSTSPLHVPNRENQDVEIVGAEI